MKSVTSLRGLATVGLLAVGVSILITLIAGGRAGRQEEQTHPIRPTQDAGGSATEPVSPSAPWPSRRGAVLLQGPTGFRLLVADTPPFVLDLDRGSAREIGGISVRGDTGVTVLPVGEHALVLTHSFCNGCPTGPGVYLVRRGNTAATRLAASSTVVPARDGEGMWMLSRRDARRCTVREVGLDGRPRGTARQVGCRSALVAELPAGLLVGHVGAGGSEAHNALVQPTGGVVRLPFANAQPIVGDLLLTGVDRRTPLLLHDVRSGASNRLRWPSRPGYSLGEVTGDPSGRVAVVEFARFSPEHKLDMWLLDTVTLRWRHLPGMPACLVPKATDVQWTADGRVVILAGNVLGIWRPYEPQLAVRLVQAARQPGSEFVVW